MHTTCVKPWWLNKTTTEVLAFLIVGHPHGKISIHIVKPRHESVRIVGVTKQPGGDNSAAGSIMPTVYAVRVRDAAGHVSVPGEIRPVLTKGSSEADVL